MNNENFKEKIKDFPFYKEQDEEYYGLNGSEIPVHIVFPNTIDYLNISDMSSNSMIICNEDERVYLLFTTSGSLRIVANNGNYYLPADWFIGKTFRVL